MRKLFVIAATLLLAGAAAFGQQMQNLPNDPETKVGKLENGLTYYIRHNDKPAQRAEFYLATHVGALQETPDQDGLAHFLEHMCFNGTKNFPDKGILDWLQSIGASFGGNVNASTGVEQTVYLLNNIPLVRPTVVDSCLLIMHDYSHFVTCDPVEIDKERGVILEEKRTRNDASWRMREKMYKYLFGDTKYANTTIIGSEENLKTFQPSSLVNFYKTWYQPCNQALIVVGDIDVAEVEAKIAATFADIPAAVDPKVKDVIRIPGNVEPIVGVITDPEATSANITMIFKSDPLPTQLNSTPVGMMTGILKGIVSSAMNERFQEIAASPDAPFVAAGLQCSDLCESCDALMAYSGFKDGGALPALEAVYTELEKLARFGLSDDEIERAKSNILSGMENAANRAETRKNSEFVQPMIANFFQNESFMDPKARLEIAKMMLPQLQTPVVNQFAQALVTKENMIVLYEGSDKVAHPSEDEILAVVKKVQNAEIAANESVAIPESFLDPAKLKGAKVKKTQPYKYGSELVTLSNGVKVILLPTEYEKDRIIIDLMREGGETLIADEDLPSFEENVWGLFLQNCGVGDIPATVVNKMLSGKNLSVNPYISDYTHGINLSSTPKDFETALQILYQQYMNPRFDSNEFDQGIKQIAAVIPNLEGQPRYKLQKELFDKLYKGNRHLLVSQDLLAKADLGTIERVYRQLFKDAAGATAIVVGDFDKETVLPLICKYIGSLPKGKKPTAWKYNGDGYVDGAFVDDFTAKMEAPKVTVVQCFKKEIPYSVESEVAFDALAYILNMVYTNTLREDEGGTYGASASCMTMAIPYERATLQVYFDTNCDQADHLRELAVKGLKDIAADGPTAEMFDMAVKNLLKKIPEKRIRNSYWSSTISTWTRRGIDKDVEYEAAVNALTPEKVKAAAAIISGDGCLAEFVMRPAE